MPYTRSPGGRRPACCRVRLEQAGEIKQDIDKESKTDAEHRGAAHAHWRRQLHPARCEQSAGCRVRPVLRRLSLRRLISRRLISRCLVFFRICLTAAWLRAFSGRCALPSSRARRQNRDPPALRIYRSQTGQCGHRGEHHLHAARIRCDVVCRRAALPHQGSTQHRAESLNQFSCQQENKKRKEDPQCSVSSPHSSVHAVFHLLTPCPSIRNRRRSSAESATKSAPACTNSSRLP